MVNFMCQCVWAMVPRYMLKYYFGCFFEDININRNILILGLPLPREHVQASMLEGGRYGAQSQDTPLAQARPS